MFKQHHALEKYIDTNYDRLPRGQSIKKRG
jgi:hypothetical protein